MPPFEEIYRSPSTGVVLGFVNNFSDTLEAAHRDTGALVLYSSVK